MHLLKKSYRLLKLTRKEKKRGEPPHDFRDRPYKNIFQHYGEEIGENNSIS